MTISEYFLEHGMPDPVKDHDFRRHLLFTLMMIEHQFAMQEVEIEDEEIVEQQEEINEDVIEKAKRILERSESQSERNWATNILIEAWEKGLLKNKK